MQRFLLGGVSLVHRSFNMVSSFNMLIESYKILKSIFDLIKRAISIIVKKKPPSVLKK